MEDRESESFFIMNHKRIILSYSIPTRPQPLDPENTPAQGTSQPSRCELNPHTRPLPTPQIPPNNSRVKWIQDKDGCQPTEPNKRLKNTNGATNPQYVHTRSNPKKEKPPVKPVDGGIKDQQKKTNVNPPVPHSRTPNKEKKQISSMILNKQKTPNSLPPGLTK